MTKPTYPMNDVRVLHLGSSWAGRVAAMLLADQGAEVIEIEPPDRRTSVEDALLGRGKIGITLDLKSDSGRHAALALAQDADIIIDNLGPGRSASFGVDYPAIEAFNPATVYISLPAFASQSEESEESDIPGWEGVINAACGVYTDIHLAEPLLGGAPRFTSIPLTSAYGGVHGAIAASMGYRNRLRSGIGEVSEAVACVPRTAAVAFRRLDELRADCELEGIHESPDAADTRSIVMQHFDHPSGYTVSLLLPTWYRTARTPIAQLRSAPFPGSDTAEVLRISDLTPRKSQS
jgi:CoA-transferase family III